MANDPLPLPGISAGSPGDPHRGDDLQDARGAQSAEDAQDAEYETIHAEIAATERGRWFLSEHVKRNRSADTDRLVGSLARAEAALRGGAAAATPNPHADDLAQLAAAIGQVEAVIAAGAAPPAGGLAASEHIQDIAFALRERETGSVLCEALESALFELGEAFAQHDAAAERAQSAAALLRGLQASINAVIALAAGSPRAEAAALDAEPPAPAPEDASDEAWPVESVPSDSVIDASPADERVEPPAAEAEPAGELISVTPGILEAATPPAAEAAADGTGLPRGAHPGDTAAFEERASGPLASDEIFRAPLSTEAVPDKAPSRTSLHGEAAVTEPPVTADTPHDEARRSAATGEESLQESAIEPAVAAQATAAASELALHLPAEPSDFASTPPAADKDTGISGQPDGSGGPDTTDAIEARWSAAADVESLLETEPADSLPTAVQLTSPQEDIDDLFEPPPLEHEARSAAASAAMRESAQQMFSPELPPLAVSSPVTQTAASPVQPAPLAATPAPVAREIPRPAPKDPLAAVRALSEEELIALFS